LKKFARMKELMASTNTAIRASWKSRPLRVVSDGAVGRVRTGCST